MKLADCMGCDSLTEGGCTLASEICIRKSRPEKIQWGYICQPRWLQECPKVTIEKIKNGLMDVPKGCYITLRGK
jgi:hypothetical protein